MNFTYPMLFNFEAKEGFRGGRRKKEGASKERRNGVAFLSAAFGILERAATVFWAKRFPFF